MSGLEHPSAKEHSVVQRSVNEALESHRSGMTDDSVRADAEAVKRLYIELGAELEKALRSDVETTPVLSYPETGPVVASLATDMRGLLLDAGCGPYPIFEASLGPDLSRTIVAMDISEGTVRLATDLSRRLALPVWGVVADVEALPFRDRVFDGSICQDTIEHLPDDRGAIAELARVLRPEGRLILATPNRVRLDVLVRRWRDRRRGISRPERDYYEANSHLREYSWRDLRNIVRGRFRVVRRASVGWTGGPRAAWATRLVRYWPFRLVSRVVIYVLEPKQRSGSARP